MPAPADFVVNNIGPNSLTIQSQTIASGASYTVAFGSIATWAKDPYMQAYVYSGQITVTVLGVLYQQQRDLLQLLRDIAAENVVFSS